MIKAQNNLKKTLVGIGVLVFAWLAVWVAKSFLGESQATPTYKFEHSEALNNEFIKLNPNTGLPYPGTYKLEKIFETPRLNALDSSSRIQPLSKYTKGKITLLTFFYERCSDANGCPYAMNVFYTVKNKLEHQNNASNLFRFVHISFDPDRDTPMMMKGLEKKVSNHKDNQIEWDFLTSKSISELMPLIDGFGQNVDVNVNSITGGKSLTYQHVLKVFLIDKDSYIREIYSTAYLNKEMILNDIETLLMEQNNKKILNESN